MIMSTLTTMRNRKNISWLALLVGIFMLLSYQLLVLRTSRSGNKVQETIYFQHSPSPVPEVAALNDTSSPEIPTSGPPATTPKDHRLDCEVIEQMKLENIVVVMRTGATEAYTKLPMHFLTTLRCFENDDLLLYSDMADTMGEFQIEDILARIPEETKSKIPDFDVYQKLKVFKNTGQEMSTFPVEWSDEEHSKAWTLDKYKFQHMLEDTYYSKPEGKWYLFMETDTYVIWSNVLRYLRSLDPAKPLYLGSAAEVLRKQFAHGGSGFIISRPALAKLFEGKERGYASKWDEIMVNECCGDYVVGTSLAEVGVPINNIWPMINGEYPATMPFGDNHWCQPLMTMHHIPPAEMSNVWRFEQERGYDTPMQIKELYFKFVEHQLRSYPVAASWDNLSDDVVYGPPDATGETTSWSSQTEKEAHLSGENCELACKSRDNCFQWVWKSGTSGEKKLAEAIRERDQLRNKRWGKINERIETDLGDPHAEDLKTIPRTAALERKDEIPDQGPTCSLSNSFKLGKFARGKENQYAGPGAELWISGWYMERIDEWIKQNECEARWVIF